MSALGEHGGAALSLVIVAAFGAVGVGQAQPLAETKAPARARGEVGAADAFALSVVEELAREVAAARAAGRTPNHALLRTDLLIGTTVVWSIVECDAAGNLRTMPGQFRSPGAAAEWGVYLLPTAAEDPPGHVFFVGAEGPALWVDNRAHGYTRENPPPAAAAFGAGDAKWSMLQRSSGKGQDGDVWQVTATIPRRQVAIEVVDEAGRPVPGIDVQVRTPLVLPDARMVPAMRSSLVELDGLRPAGLATTDGQGRAVVRGAAAHGLVMLVTCGGSPLPIVAEGVTATDAVIRVVVKSGDESKRRPANESAAIATLKNIASAQSQCQASGVIDADADGRGEYGFFGELSGALPVRSDARGGATGPRISPPVLSTAFSRVRESQVQRSGYRFQIWLRGPSGKWVAEAAAGGGDGVAVDADGAETQWCCFAWPAHALCGTRAFFVDHNGDVLACANEPLDLVGTHAPQPWDGGTPTGWQAIR